MAHNVEPMDVDSSVCDFDNKENSCHHSNVLPRTPCTEKGYEELDVAELNMKVRYSLSPNTSSMSKSFTANCLENRNYESGDNTTTIDNGNLTRSLNCSIAKSDITNKSLKVHPLQVLPVDQFIDSNRNPLRSLESSTVNNVTVTLSGSDENDGIISFPSTSSSLVHTPEALTPSSDFPKADDGGSPIIRGLKSVLSMFRSSQSPIPPSEDENKPQDKEVLSPSLINSPETADSRPQAILASTPLAAYKTKDALSKRNSPNRDNLVFNDDLEKELHWKDETTIFFSHERIPIHKLFLQNETSSASVKHDSKNPDEATNQDKRDATVEYMDISYNDSIIMNEPATEIQCDEIPNKSIAVESDSEFLDCESTFTENESQLEISIQCPPPSDNEIGNLLDVENKLGNKILNINATEKPGNTTEESVNTTLSVTSTDLSMTPTVSMKGLYTNFDIVPVPQKAIDLVKQEEFEVKKVPSALEKCVSLDGPELTLAHMENNPTFLIEKTLDTITNVDNNSIHEANALNNSPSFDDATQPNLVLDRSIDIDLVKVDIVDTASTPDLGVSALSQIPLIADPRVLLFNIPLQNPIDEVNMRLDVDNMISATLSPASIPLPEDSEFENEKNASLSTDSTQLHIVVNDDLLIKNNDTNDIDQTPKANICDKKNESIVEEISPKIKETDIRPYISVHDEGNNLDDDRLCDNLQAIDLDQRKNVSSVEVDQNVSNDRTFVAENMVIPYDLIKELCEPAIENENPVTLADVAIAKEIILVATNVTFTEESVQSNKGNNNQQPEESTPGVVMAKENVRTEKNVEPEVEEEGALPIDKLVGDSVFDDQMPQRISPIEVEYKVDIDAGGINLVCNSNTTEEINLSDIKEEATAYVTDTNNELVIPQGESPVMLDEDMIHHNTTAIVRIPTNVINALESSVSELPSADSIDITKKNKEVDISQGEELGTTPEVIESSYGINTSSTILPEDENDLMIVEPKNKEVKVSQKTGAPEFDSLSEVIKPTDDINTSANILPAAEIVLMIEELQTNNKDGSICLEIGVQEMDTNTSEIIIPNDDINKSTTNLPENEIARMIKEPEINYKEAGICLETGVQEVHTNTYNVIKPTDDIITSAKILPAAEVALMIEELQTNNKDGSICLEIMVQEMDTNTSKIIIPTDDINSSTSNLPENEIDQMIKEPEINHKESGICLETGVQEVHTNTSNVIKPTNEVVISTSILPNTGIAPTLEENEINIPSDNCIIHAESYTVEDKSSVKEELQKHDKLDENEVKLECLDKKIVASESNSPFVSVTAGELTCNEALEGIENYFTTKTKIQMSPPCSPKIVSKGYNFNFDEIDDPFATKTKIRLSPPPGASPNQSFDHFEQKSEFPLKDSTSIRRKSQPERKKRPVTNKKINSTFAGSPTDHKIADKSKVVPASTIVEEITLDVVQNNAEDISSPGATKELLNVTSDIKTDIVAKISDTEKATDKIQNEEFKSSIESVITLPNETRNASSSEHSTYYSAGTSSTEGIEPKNVFNLPEFDDKDFNPFTTKSKIRQSPPPSIERNDQLGTESNIIISSDCLKVHESYKKDFNADTTVNIEPISCLPTVVTNLEDKTKILGTDLRERDSTDNMNMTSSSKVSDMDNTVQTVRTEDQDTIEGPFLEAEDLDDVKMADFSGDNADMMQFSDFPAQVNDDNDAAELFIDAEAFEFLLNQNQGNVVADSGKESLFLKFDPLFAKRMSSDGVVAALNKLHKRQSTPKKPTSPPTKKILKSPIAGPSILNVTPEIEVNNITEESNDDLNITVSKPMMVVNPAVNPVVTPRNKTITPVRTNRQSLTFTSPAIAVIDRLLSMSANNSFVGHDATIAEVNNEQNEANVALMQLRELLADKEINVYNLRSESKELKDRLTSLETQMHMLESISEERLKNINELTDKLNEKTKTNKSMATVVAEYERTVASLITETEQEKKQHADERIQLMRERDEQTNHLASMEVSFSDLHSKYEKSKQVILALKANEDTVKKSIKEFEANLAKMQNNYELLKQHATSKLNHANEELQKMNRAHEAEMLKLNAMIKRKELHITSLEETLLQKTKANEELTAICDELINKVG